VVEAGPMRFFSGMKKATAKVEKVILGLLMLPFILAVKHDFWHELKVYVLTPVDFKTAFAFWVLKEFIKRFRRGRR